MRATKRSVAAVTLIVTAIVSAASIAFANQAESHRYVGRAVVDVLRDLQKTSLRIIFSTELVPPTLRVMKEPRASDAREIAIQILEPHGLTLEQGPGGTFLIVAARHLGTTPKPALPKVVGSRPRPDADPSSETTPELPRVEEHVEVTGRSGLGGTARGYSLEPSAVREIAGGGMDHVLQTLQILPGAVATNDDEGKLAVRGAGPEHNLIVLDGVQIHSPQRFGEYTTSLLNPATASRITLDPSGLDAGFGGRLSSFVSLETRDGRTDRSLAVSGSLGLTSGDVLLEGRMPGTTSGSWWATGRGTYYRFVANQLDDNAGPSFVDVHVKATLYPTTRTRVTVVGLAGREVMQQVEHDGHGATTVEARHQGNNRIAAGTLRWTPTSRFNSDTTISAYSTSSRDVDNLLAAFSDLDRFDRHIEVRDLAVRHQILYEMSNRHMMSAGVDLHRVRSSWRMAGTKQPDWWRGIGPSTWGELVDYSAGPVDARLERTQTAAWLQHRSQIGALITIEPGIRLDWNSFTGEAAWQPRVRASRLFGKTSVWAGFSGQAQTPAHESLQGFEYFDISQDESPHLRNARARQLVVGIGRPLSHGFSVRLETYRRRFDRLLVQRPETEDERQNRLREYVIPPDLPSDHSVLEYRPTIAAESTGRGRSSGVELLVRCEAQRVSGWLAYTLSKATRELYGRTQPFDFDRTHALSAGILVSLGSRYRAAATWQLASGLPTTPVQTEVSFGQTINIEENRLIRDPLYRTFRSPDGQLVSGPNVWQRRLSSVNSERLSGYSRVDARLTYSTRRHWEFYGEVINAFNHRNHVQTVHQNDGVGGRTLVGSTNVYDTFGRMLTFGIRAKF